MSKYDALWAYVRQEKSPRLKLTFAQIETLLGFRSTSHFYDIKRIAGIRVSGRETLHKGKFCYFYQDGRDLTPADRQPRRRYEGAVYV